MIKKAVAAVGAFLLFGGTISAYTVYGATIRVQAYSQPIVYPSASGVYVDYPRKALNTPYIPFQPVASDSSNNIISSLTNVSDIINSNSDSFQKVSLSSDISSDVGKPKTTTSSTKPESTSTTPESTSTTPESTSMTPESTTPESTTPESTTPESTTPESTTPESTTPKSTTPESTTPKSTTPESTTPESTTPESTTPESTTPESTTPESTTPESTTPESTTPESTTPESTTPESTTPESTTPESTTPESTTPESTTPESTTPESTTPESTTPESTTPESTTPESTTPESTTPESTTPESTTPESTTPESTTPESTSTTPESTSTTPETTSTFPFTTTTLPVSSCRCIALKEPTLSPDNPSEWVSIPDNTAINAMCKKVDKIVVSAMIGQDCPAGWEDATSTDGDPNWCSNSGNGETWAKTPAALALEEDLNDNGIGCSVSCHQHIDCKGNVPTAGIIDCTGTYSSCDEAPTACTQKKPVYSKTCVYHCPEMTTSPTTTTPETTTPETTTPETTTPETTTSPFTTTTTPITTTFDCSVVINNMDSAICKKYRAEAERCCEEAGGVLDNECFCCIGCDTTTTPLTTTTTPFTTTSITTTFDCNIVVNNMDPTICEKYPEEAKRCCEEAGGVLDDTCSCCIGCGDNTTTTTPLTTTTTPLTTTTTPITTTTPVETETCCEETI